MNRLGAIAYNTFREAMRSKLLYSIVLFACVLILSGLVLGQFVLNEQLRLTRDLGLGGISFFGVALAVFAGVSMVYKEIERKTVYALIPKPLHRWQFVVGKYLGMVLTLAVQMGLMAVVLCIALWLQGGAPDAPLCRAILLLFGQVAVIAAVAILFSTFSTPFLSGLFTVGVFIIGRYSNELHAVILAKLKESPELAKVLLYGSHVLPDLHLFFVSGGTVAGKTVSVNAGDYVNWTYVASASAYGLAYAGCVLALAIWSFSRRDFV